jgi:hypothetical protein
VTSADADARIERWLAALEERHLADLTFAEVSRALRALSSCYVERRSRIASGGALDGAGKRAAFALFYGPLHFLLVRHIAASLGTTEHSHDSVIDLGCGTGVGGAGCAIVLSERRESKGSRGNDAVSIHGIDRHPWAVQEADWTWRTLALRGRAVVGDARRWRPPRTPAAIVAAYAVNEWPPDVRTDVRPRLLDAVESGSSLLVVEPLAGAVAPWWKDWVEAATPLGGLSHEWRIRVPLPGIVARLDRAAGLDHRELTARSLFVPARRASARRASGRAVPGADR